LRTDFARGIGHGSDDRCGRSYHFRELADSNTGQDADEKLLLQSFLHPGFAQDCAGKLWFTAEGMKSAGAKSRGAFRILS
jgi:hypothetical protein